MQTSKGKNKLTLIDIFSATFKTTAILQLNMLIHISVIVVIFIIVIQVEIKP